MPRSSCCCFFPSENSDSERQPLLPPRASDLNEATSARQIQPQSIARTKRRIGRLVIKHVGVPELDQRFSEVAETFNKQQEHYEAMAQHIRRLQQNCGFSCTDTLTFAECVGKLREEYQATYKVCLKINGYDFSLIVVPMGLEGECEKEPLPPSLKLAQDDVRRTSCSAKDTISKDTILKEMLIWLTNNNDQMAEQVKQAAPSYQEHGRLKRNLEENMREMKRAKELSAAYKKQVAEVFAEAAQIAGAYS
ncbi:uncharacterized protein LOC115050560 [Echeneis naucrates]|uniref:uncharacterized protein LOC115050560 n=1 Tax=Echeneis naucrates TaxID=173247 RepID=UPI0011139F8C|nr:uncharacterized protein LOC115050560 [Echeneis naucrates]